MGRSLTLPSARIAAAAEMAAVSLYPGEKRPLCAIDVGCDHAKLSAYLIQSGLCSHAVAADINDGPLEKARKNLKSRTFGGKSLDSYIDIVKTDGLRGLENRHAERIFILGMGGELIADILEAAPFIRYKENAEKIGLVLQPMTSADVLRKYLYQSGFRITSERLVLDKGRIYAVILAVYDGITRSTTHAGYLLGDINIKERAPLFEAELERRIRITEKALCGAKSAGLDVKELSELLEELKSIKQTVA